MITLHGITWDHTRGYDPLIAVNADHAGACPQVQVIWDKRSLKDFGDYPIALLAERYDLLVLDHPFMARAYEDGILVDLCRHIGGHDLLARAKASVGQSHQSYEYKGTWQALAVDAAAQVAAARDDLLGDLGLPTPRSFEEVLELARHLPHGMHIASTMKPADLFSTFLGLCAQLAGTSFFDPESAFPPALGEESVALLRKLLAACHPESLNMNPIEMLEHMALQDDIVYCAYLYGYTNYSRARYRPRLITFYDAPLLPGARASTLLGGTGLAVSRRCAHPDAAAAYILHATGTAVQTGVYYRGGGQPADIHAWRDPAINADCNFFFLNTLNTLENAYVRPKVPAWNVFQEKGGDLLNALLRTDIAEKDIAVQLGDLYRNINSARAQH